MTSSVSRDVEIEANGRTVSGWYAGEGGVITVYAGGRRKAPQAGDHLRRTWRWCC